MCVVSSVVQSLRRYVYLDASFLQSDLTFPSKPSSEDSLSIDDPNPSALASLAELHEITLKLFLRVEAELRKSFDIASRIVEDEEERMSG